MPVGTADSNPQHYTDAIGQLRPFGLALGLDR